MVEPVVRTPKHIVNWSSSIALVLLAACGAPDRNGASSGTGTSTGTGGIDGDGDGDSTSDGGETTDGTATDGGDTPTDDGDGGGGAACDGQVMACGDGEDNDGDGKVDGDDPECTGVCDDDEGSFATGIPGDNKDCKQDCFFDGNSGQGDDGCNWDLRCDPENPGADIGCEYTGGNNCNGDTSQDQYCIDFCEGNTPNGCDCFGCCKVQTDDGEVTVFLGSGTDCNLNNLDACESCTFNDDCGNDCDPESCEVCFGEDSPPEGCDDPTCPDGEQPCTSDAECAEDMVCITGCCTSYVPPQ